MCVVICMSNQNEMQTNFPAGLNLSLSCYLFGFGDDTFFSAARVTTGLQKRAAVVSAHGPCVDHIWFGAGQDAMEETGRAQQSARCVSPRAVACQERHLALRPCDGIALVRIIADTQT